MLAELANPVHGAVERSEQLIDLLARVRIIHPQQLKAQTSGREQRTHLVMQGLSGAPQFGLRPRNRLRNPADGSFAVPDILDAGSLRGDPFTH